MNRTHAIVIMVGLLLLAGGCAGSGRMQEASVSAGPKAEQPAGDPASIDLTAGTASPCLERHGFTILSFRAIRDSYDQVSVVGEIKNTGPASRGVELQAALRDRSGRVVAVGHFFPASYRNIVPDETWPFTYSFGKQEGAVEAELRIVGAFRTTDALNVASTMP